MSNANTTIILFYNDGFEETLSSILKQNQSSIEVIVIAENEIEHDFNKRISEAGHVLKITSFSKTNFGRDLNLAFKQSTNDFIMLIDNRENPVTLKIGALDLFILGCKRSKKPGMVYSDYELYENNNVKEIHLLKPHIGRVRDNQDYGKVYFFNRMALDEIGYCNPDVKFNTLYDLRLRISEEYDLIHLANRYSGSLYRISAEGKKQNVFDYLLASKESQLEAENVLTAHLKNIGAKLEPSAHYMNRPAKNSDATLKASVIIPVNNRPDFIATAIESVQNQTIKDVEIIIAVNGGEDDPTIKAVKRYMSGGDKFDESKPAVRLMVFEINNLGLCLNMGAQIATGQYYIQLDSDDRLKPDAVEKICAVFEEDANIGMVIGSYEVWEQQSDGRITRMEDLPVVTHDEWTEENGRNNLLRINGAGAPRSIPIQLIREVGFSVNEEPYCRNYGEDYGMVLKLSEKHKIGRVWDAIYEVIRHSGGTDHSIDQATVDRNDEAKDYMRKEAILRRIKLNRG